MCIFSKTYIPTHVVYIRDYGVYMHIDLQQLNCIAVVIRTCAYNVKRELRGVLPDVPLPCLYIYIYIYNKLYYITLYIRHIHAHTHALGTTVVAIVLYMYDILFLSFFLSLYYCHFFLHPATPLQTM